jgi:hypothetical protein
VKDNARLIPIWLGVTRADVARLNPALADLVSIPATQSNVESCALEILRAVRPQLYENMFMLAQLDSAKITIGSAALDDLKKGPIRHHDLPAALLVRIQNIWFATRDVFSWSLEDFVENFQRDLRPEGEIEVWERITSALHIATDILNTDALEVRTIVFDILLHFSMGMFEWAFDEAAAGSFSEGIATAAAQAWLQAVPPTTVCDVESGNA